ncbi:DUF7059 domain-containing protein [Rothia aerolata]|uniref:Methyltransferase n=1 Tax=Rothia aerolata TaxID=1812262 RepID=A0A917IRI7_9MICC|nr:methyltransferase [Rothia aerolata]GGH61129.1 methyltransferase [Rothia aerolata]
MRDYPEFSNVKNAPASYDPKALAQLADALRAVNYSYEGIENLLGEGPFAAMARDQIVPGRYRVKTIREDSTASVADRNLATVVAFFMLGDELTEKQLNTALGAGAVKLLRAVRLAELSPAETYEPTYRAAVDLRPHSADDGTDLWVSSDLGAHQRPGVLRKDHVLGIGQASLSLAQFTERRPVKKALDLGTGCGIQTFHLLDHAEHVTATDISDRALAFTRFNLLLNAQQLGLNPENLGEKVTLKQGSLLEPVAGEKFDLVVSNPPFVITPRHENETAEDQYTYRDGGLAGDGIVSTLVTELPKVLNPGARAQMLGNWEIPVSAGEEAADWTARLREWVGENTEAWFIQREVLSPEQYAETWLRDASENRDPKLFESAYLDYIRDFASRGVDSVGFGMIWLRAPETNQAHRLQRFEEITYSIQQPIAPFITEAVDLYDAVAPLTDEQLAALHLTVAGDVTEERHGSPGAEHPGVILLREGAGLRRTVLMSTETAGFVSACDGELAVGQIVNALSALLDWDSADTQDAALGGSAVKKQELLGHVRELVEKAFLRIEGAGE